LTIIYVITLGLANELSMLFYVLSFTEIKQTQSLDGSSVLPFDLLKAELFYPNRKENVATTSTVQKMAVEMAMCFLTELRDKKGYFRLPHKYGG